MILTITTDGSAIPNPGRTRIGGIVEDEAGNILNAFSEDAGFGTSNTAEYKAIIRGLIFARDAGARIVIAYMDSQLCERQLNGVYAVSAENLRPLYGQVKALEKFFTRVRFRWQPRTEGKQPLADALAAGGARAMGALESIQNVRASSTDGTGTDGTRSAESGPDPSPTRNIESSDP